MQIAAFDAFVETRGSPVEQEQKLSARARVRIQSD